MHFLVTRGWDNSVAYPQVAYAVDDATERVGGALRSLAPESGAYINEVSIRKSHPVVKTWRHLLTATGRRPRARLAKDLLGSQLRQAPRDQEEV